jgi:hypothetical protein
MIKQLEIELEASRQNGKEFEVREADGLIYIIFKNFQLPPGYNKQHTRLLLKIPLSYPNGNPDMFWVDPDLRLASGGNQASANIETVLGESWLRFSWHPQKWNPVLDNLGTFTEFVNRRLKQLK